MAKEKEKEKVADDENGEAGESAEVKQGFVKKLLGNRKMLIIAATALAVVLGGAGAGTWFFLFNSKPDAAKIKVAAAQAGVPLVPPKVAFFDMPDVVVNIQSPDGSPAYLKLSVALELRSADEEAGLKVLVPRVIDQFQSYLRELRVSDLQGSESVLRVKEELLRRIKVAAAPYPVRDVLLKEMIVQ